MQRDVSRDIESETPTRVLLVGNHWDLLQPSLKALTDRGGFVFIELAGPHFRVINSQVPPLVIVIGPDFADAHNILTLKSQFHEQPIPPRFMLCITHESLENDDLYPDLDDFLIVPCSTAEMGKRIKRLARKDLPSQPSTQLCVGKIALDLNTYQVVVEGKRVDLAWMEFQLLKFLMENQGRVFTREQLLAEVWGVGNFGGTRTVDVHIRRLRSKLETQRDGYFRTVANVGYGMVSPR